MLNKAKFTACKVHLFLDNLFFILEKIDYQINFKIKSKICTSKRYKRIEENNVLKKYTNRNLNHNLFFFDCQKKINLLDNLENYVFFFKKITNINFKINSKINLSGFGFIFFKNLIQIFITNKNKIFSHMKVKKFWTLISNLNMTDQLLLRNSITTTQKKYC
nr:hypothetical protein CparaKRNrm3_p108 [Cryptomonas paramecium]